MKKRNVHNKLPKEVPKGRVTCKGTVGSIRAQITIFVIVGVIIVALAGAGVYMGKLKIESDLANEYFSQANIKPQLENIQSAILECMDITTYDALTVIGIQGGFYDEPSQSFDLGWAFIPYFYNQGAFLMPEKLTIENELSKSINENLPLCLDEINFETFNLDYGITTTRTSITKGKVLFKIDNKITIQREDNKIKFETKDHPIEQESKLYEMIEIADFITTSHKEDPEMICINCVADMARERDVYVDMMDFADETTTLILISENVTSSEPYIFEFLNKYPDEVAEVQAPA